MQAVCQVMCKGYFMCPLVAKLISHMGEVSELWRKTMVTNYYSHVFNLRKCSVVFKM